MSMPTDEIVVTAAGKPFTMELDDLRRAEAAFVKDHARYAPGSTLHFRISPRGGGGTLAGFQLAATDGHATMPVALSAGGDIRLPDGAGSGWSLVGNRSAAAVRFRILVMSPGSAEDDRRLGDLRLQCRVVWAMFRSHVSILLRGAFDAAGGCGTNYSASTTGSASRSRQRVPTSAIAACRSSWASRTRAIACPWPTSR